MCHRLAVIIKLPPLGSRFLQINLDEKHSLCQWGSNALCTRFTGRMGGRPSRDKESRPNLNRFLAPLCSAKLSLTSTALCSARTSFGPRGAQSGDSSPNNSMEEQKDRFPTQMQGRTPYHVQVPAESFVALLNGSIGNTKPLFMPTLRSLPAIRQWPLRAPGSYPSASPERQLRWLIWRSPGLTPISERYSLGGGWLRT
jgi:hypothetical protein